MSKEWAKSVFLSIKWMSLKNAPEQMAVGMWFLESMCTHSAAPGMMVVWVLANCLKRAVLRWTSS